MSRFLNPKKGLGLVELVIVIGISTLILFGFSQMIFLSNLIFDRTENLTKAFYLAEEAIEATRIFRDRTSWSSNGLGSLAIGSPYYPRIINNDWSMVAGEEIIDGEFRRFIRIERVYRDANDNIAISGSEDSGSRKITVTVQGLGAVKIPEVKITTYLMSWR